MPIRRRLKNRRGERGQSLAEFAFVLPILLLLTLVSLDFGRVYLGYLNLQNMARVAANYAAAHPSAWSGTGDAIEQAAYASQVLSDAHTTNCALPGNSVPAPVFPSGTAVGQTATVSLTCSFSIVTPIISDIVGDSVAVSASAVFPIKSGITATGGPGQSDPTADFVGQPLSGAAPLDVAFTDLSSSTRGAILTWEWSFGDGGTASTQSPTHTYAQPGTYTVSLTVNDGTDTGTATKTSYIVVTDPTEVAFSGTPTAGKAPLAVQFTDESAGNPTGWNWDFGDGDTSTLQHPSHTYQTKGTYDVSLEIITATGTASLTKSAYIVVNVCKVPDFSAQGGVYWSGAQSLWDAAGFTTQMVNRATDNKGNPITDYKIKWQSITGASDVFCNSVIEVSNKAP